MGNKIELKRHSDLVCLLASVNANFELDQNECQRLERFVSANVRMIEIVRDGFKGLGHNHLAKEIDTLIQQRNNIKQKRKYLCFWDSVSFSVGGTREVDDDFFSKVNAYDPPEIDAIENLNVGQIWESPDYGKAHTVKRLS